MKLFTLLLLLCSTYVNAQYAPKATGKITQHTYYSLQYSEQHEQPTWVYYRLTPSKINGQASRTDNFRVDPKILSESAELGDYKNSGYDRGHLCPAGDMKQSKTAMSETFYMSNMSPQLPSFNRGIWNKIEQQVRKLAANDTLYIATGPIFKNSIKTIGENQVTIPTAFYKVIYSPRRKSMLALLVPHKGSSAHPSQFVVPVDSIESITGIDFFPALSDNIENKLESQQTLLHWKEMIPKS